MPPLLVNSKLALQNGVLADFIRSAIPTLFIGKVLDEHGSNRAD